VSRWFDSRYRQENLLSFSFPRLVQGRIKSHVQWVPEALFTEVNTGVNLITRLYLELNLRMGGVVTVPPICLHGFTRTSLLSTLNIIFQYKPTYIYWYLSSVCLTNSLYTFSSTPKCSRIILPTVVYRCHEILLYRKFRTLHTC
jgi:hypothetical protein